MKPRRASHSTKLSYEERISTTTRRSLLAMLLVSSISACGQGEPPATVTADEATLDPTLPSAVAPPTSQDLTATTSTSVATSDEDPTGGEDGPKSCIDPECPSQSPPQTDRPPDDIGHRKGRPIEKQVRTDLNDVRERPVETAYADRADAEIVLAYWGGTDTCETPASVEVEESARWVRVRVRVGVAPDRSEPCPEIAEWQGVRVVLTQSLGNRSVVDAANNDTIVPVEEPI